MCCSCTLTAFGFEVVNVHLAPAPLAMGGRNRVGTDTAGYVELIAVTVEALPIGVEPVYTSILLMWLMPLTVIRLVWPIRSRGLVMSSVLLLAAFATYTAAVVAACLGWRRGVGRRVVVP